MRVKAKRQGKPSTRDKERTKKRIACVYKIIIIIIIALSYPTCLSFLLPLSKFSIFCFHQHTLLLFLPSLHSFHFLLTTHVSQALLFKEGEFKFCFLILFLSFASSLSCSLLHLFLGGVSVLF